MLGKHMCKTLNTRGPPYTADQRTLHPSRIAALLQYSFETLKPGSELGRNNLVLNSVADHVTGLE
jgi:hypothetical protein